MSSFLSLFVHHKVMQKKWFIGIDISKKKLDLYLRNDKGFVLQTVLPNNQNAIQEVMVDIINEQGIDSHQLIICAEHTGQYSYPLSCACNVMGLALWLENPTQIKYCSGMTRGKNDKVDSKRIADYAFRFADQSRVHKRLDESIERLKQLEAERKLYVNDIAKYRNQISDQKEYMSANIYEAKAKRLHCMVSALEDAKRKVEEEMDRIVSESESLSRQMELLQSIDGIGKVVALNMIVATQGFTRFENARQFSCYAGVAPFAYISGSSQHSRNRVSHRADKHIKSLLHLAAVSVVHKKSGQLKEYFERKVGEGKNKMTVINAVRAKIIARMFSVIRNDRKYQPDLLKKIC